MGAKLAVGWKALRRGGLKLEAWAVDRVMRGADDGPSSRPPMHAQCPRVSKGPNLRLPVDLDVLGRALAGEHARDRPVCVIGGDVQGRQAHNRLGLGQRR